MDHEDRMRRVRARTIELCEHDSWDPDTRSFARTAWLAAQETNMGAVSKEFMTAFAEELFGRRHPGSPPAGRGEEGAAP